MPEIPNQSWELKNIRLPKDEMIQAIEGANSVPAACKAMLIEKVNAFDPKARFLRLDAHCHVVKHGPKNAEKTMDILHVSLTEV